MTNPAVEALVARSNRLGADPRNTNYAGGNTSAKGTDIDPVTGAETTSILLLRVGEGEQGVVGLQKSGVTGEIEPGLSVRYMGTNDHSIASHLVTRYFSAAVLVEDAIARLDNVLLGNYHDYA